MRLAYKHLERPNDNYNALAAAWVVKLKKT